MLFSFLSYAFVLCLILFPSFFAHSSRYLVWIGLTLLWLFSLTLANFSILTALSKPKMHDKAVMLAFLCLGLVRRFQLLFDTVYIEASFSSSTLLALFIGLYALRYSGIVVALLLQSLNSLEWGCISLFSRSKYKTS